MRSKKDNTQLFLVPGAIVAVAVFLFIATTTLSKKSESSISLPLSNTPDNAQVSPTPETTSSPGTPEAPSLSGITSTPSPVSAEPIPPDPKALGMLVPSEIDSVTPKGNGYIVTTTFGANWFIAEQQVEQLPQSMKIRIDYGKYGAGANHGG